MITRLKQCSDEMIEFRKWLVVYFPDSFPEGEATDISLVIEKAKELITRYINITYLLEG